VVQHWKDPLGSGVFVRRARRQEHNMRVASRRPSVRTLIPVPEPIYQGLPR
jgi:hypothetical protein